MKKILFTAMILLFCVSCVTRPQVIDKKYMVNMTDKEKETIDALEVKAVDKNQENTAAKKEYEAVIKEGDGEDKKLSDLEDELFKLKDEERLYKAQKDTEKLDATVQNMKQKEMEIENQKKVTQFYNTKKEMYLSNWTVKQAELSVVISELDFEKSKVAKRNRDKEIEKEKENQAANPAPEKESFFDKFKKTESQSYDVNKYEKYYIEQQDKLRKTVLDNDKRKADFEKAKNDFDALNASK